MEQIRKRRQLSGSSAGHKTKRIFYSLHLRESSPSTHTPLGWSPQSLVPRSKCEQALSVGGQEPWPRSQSARRGAGGREFPAGAPLLPLRAVRQISSLVSVVPSLPPPPPVYSLSKTIKKRSTSLTSRSPFQ